MLTFKEYITEVRRGSPQALGALITGAISAHMAKKRRQQKLAAAQNQYNLDSPEGQANFRQQVQKAQFKSALKKATGGSIKTQSTYSNSGFVLKKPKKRPGDTAYTYLRRQDTAEYKQRKAFTGRKYKADFERERVLAQKMQDYKKETQQNYPGELNKPKKGTFSGQNN